MTDTADLATVVRDLLREGVHGLDAAPAWFADAPALVPALRTVDARTASSPLRPNGPSLAGHAGHVTWFLGTLNAFARGERPPIDWAESWRVRTVDPEAWTALLDDLGAQADELDRHLAEGALEGADAERLRPVLATVAHVAYHLGAVRTVLAAERHGTDGDGPPPA